MEIRRVARQKPSQALPLGCRSRQTQKRRGEAPQITGSISLFLFFPHFHACAFTSTVAGKKQKARLQKTKPIEHCRVV